MEWKDEYIGRKVKLIQKGNTNFGKLYEITAKDRGTMIKGNWPSCGIYFTDTFEKYWEFVNSPLNHQYWW